MHPVELNEYVVPSNALEEWVNLIALWARGNVSGGITPGRQRAGKSFAIAYFVANFRKWLGNSVGVVSTEVPYQRSTSDGKFWRGMLRSMGHPSTKHDPEVARELFVGRLVDAAASSEHKKVVVIIDEANLLDAVALQLLSGVHNDLFRIHHVKCLWVLVGQPELSTLKATLRAEGKKQLVARFMRDEYTFRTLDRMDDVDAVAKCLDETLRYPKNGPFYAEHFAPVPYRHGYRLVQDTSVIVETLDEELSNNGLGGTGGFSMEGFIEVINHLLINQLPKLRVGDHLTKEMVLESARATTWLVCEQSEALLSDGPDVNAKAA